MGYGNLAYKLDTAYEEPKKKTKVSGVKKAKTAVKARLNLKLVFLMLLVSFSAYFMISKNVIVYETSQEIKSMNKKLSDLEAYTSQKIFELEQSVDLTTVEQEATTKLKMQRPEKYQTVYVNINHDDETEITVKDVEGLGNKVSDTADNLKRNLFGIFKMSWK